MTRDVQSQTTAQTQPHELKPDALRPGWPANHLLHSRWREGRAGISAFYLLTGVLNALWGAAIPRH